MQRKVVLALATIYLIWGASFAVTRVGVRHLPPFLFGGLRFLLAGALLFALSWLLGNRPRINATELRHLVAVGLGSVVISNGANVWGMQYLPSSYVALLGATAALWIALLSMFGPRAHALDWRALIGLLLGFTGTALVLGGAGSVAGRTAGMGWLPDIVVLCGVIGWSVATFYQRSFHSRLDIMSFTGAHMLIGGTVLTLAGTATGEWPRWHFNAEGLLPFAYMVFMSSIVAYTAYAWLAKHTTPAIVGSYSYVNPAIATLLGWLLLDETLSAAQLMGMLAMLAGVALASWPRGRATSVAAPN